MTFTGETGAFKVCVRLVSPWVLMGSFLLAEMGFHKIQSRFMSVENPDSSSVLFSLPACLYVKFRILQWVVNLTVEDG